MTVHMRNGEVLLEQLASGKTTEDDGQASCFQVRRAWNGGTPAPPQIAHQHTSTPVHSIRPAVSPDQGNIDSFRVWPVKECPHFLLYLWAEFSPIVRGLLPTSFFTGRPNSF
jgi:hypothetical protein